MTDIKYRSLGPKDALKTFGRNIKLFQSVMNKDETIKGIESFKLNEAERRHVGAASTDIYLCAFEFKKGRTRFSLDMSKDIESFGYNGEFFVNYYKNRIDNIWCCQICTYRDDYSFDEIISESVFLYDEKTKEVVEILELSKRGLDYYDDGTIRQVREPKKLEMVLQELKSSQK